MLSTGWHSRRVLVTGGAGFLGSNLCLALAGQGARLRVLDGFVDASGANRTNLGSLDLELLEGDLLSADLGAACRDVDTVFNLAARTSHILGQADPSADLATNAAAQLRLIEAVRDHAPAAIVVHASTRQVYGRPHHLLVSEDHPVQPCDANGISKLAGEQYWALERRLNNRRVVILRPTNCYGPRQHLRDARHSFLGEWIRCVLTGKPFEVWDGTQMRDFLFVNDAVSALIAAADTQACHGETYNIGGAPPVSLTALADLLLDLRGVPEPKGYRRVPMPAGRGAIDIGDFVTDDRRFRLASGWQPSVGLRDGLQATLDWFRPRLPQYAAV